MENYHYTWKEFIYKENMFSTIRYYIESIILWFVVKITNYLPVKIIRDDNGTPFLYRYHIIALTKDGPGICIHHFVRSDPDRGYHDHPWKKSISFILSGKYNELIYNPKSKVIDQFKRNTWNFNYLDGSKFHRVMLNEGEDAWTLFFFQKRAKVWGMYSLTGENKQMSTAVEDQDGGWWLEVMKGLGVHSHLEHPGKVIATVDILVIAEGQLLLIQRGKEPFKGHWAFPGGRIEQKDENILEAAKRELEEETGLKNLTLQHMDTIGNNYRDPRGFCLTSVFVVYLSLIPKVKAGDDAVNYMWAPLEELPPMAFDHEEIVSKMQ